MVNSRIAHPIPTVHEESGRGQIDMVSHVFKLYTGNQMNADHKKVVHHSRS